MVSDEPVLLIVGADRRELAPLAERLQDAEGLPWTAPWAVGGRLASMPVALVAGGVGRQRAAAAVQQAAEHVPLRGVVSTGWCGGLDPGLAVAEVVVADRVFAQGD